MRAGKHGGRTGREKQAKMSMVDVLGVGGTLLYGFKVAIIGMTVVFVGLIILIAMIHVISAVLNYALAKKTDAEGSPSDLSPVRDWPSDQDQHEMVAVIAAAVAAAEDEDGDEIAAVIAAALAALDENQGSPIRIMSRTIRENSPVWSMRGRVETMGTR
jgi:sodium pump decarboxylase gamma subunit